MRTNQRMPLNVRPWKRPDSWEEPPDEPDFPCASDCVDHHGAKELLSFITSAMSHETLSQIVDGIYEDGEAITATAMLLDKLDDDLAASLVMRVIRRIEDRDKLDQISLCLAAQALFEVKEREPEPC